LDREGAIVPLAKPRRKSSRAHQIQQPTIGFECDRFEQHDGCIASTAALTQSPWLLLICGRQVCRYGRNTRRHPTRCAMTAIFVQSAICPRLNYPSHFVDETGSRLANIHFVEIRMFRSFISFRLGTLAVALWALSTGVVRAEFAPIDGWDHQLFPSYVVATATIRFPESETDEDAEVQVLGDQQGMLGVRILSPGDDVPVTVTITSDSILEPSTFTGTLATQDTIYAIFPRIKYKYGMLMKNKQPIPISVTFRVEVGDEEPEEHTATMTLRSVNDCPFTVSHGESITDVSFVFAAYVNEQHPFVDKVLREGLNGGVVDSFTGYQSGDAAEVYRQVYALWHALTERDLRYSNITTSAADSASVSSQHVRLIDESINNAQANCVDGSVLLASLLRKIDIEPMLVFIPGHCYLAFFLDKEQTQLVALETTLIGSAADDSTREIDGMKDVVDDEWQKKDSWATFCAAIAMGNQDIAENKDKFGDKADVDYQLVSIAAARKLGILPIAFDSSEKFEAVSSDSE
jgi:hypothetical protein